MTTETRDVLAKGDDGSGLGEGRSQEEGYDLASADVVLPLATGEAMAIADALELLDGLDEGEHTDHDQLVRLARLVRESVPPEAHDRYEPDGREFLSLVETEWWRLMQGDLMLVAPEGDENGPTDEDLVRVVSDLASVAQAQTAAMRDAVEQYGADGATPLPGNVVTAEEMARRIALALSVALYGGGGS